MADESIEWKFLNLEGLNSKFVNNLPEPTVFEDPITLRTGIKKQIEHRATGVEWQSVAEHLRVTRVLLMQLMPNLVKTAVIVLFRTF